MTWGHIVVGVVSAALVFAGTVVAARWQARVGKQANDTTNWDRYGQRMEALHDQHVKWTKEQLASRDQQLDTQGKRISSLEGTVKTLEQENEFTKTKYWKSIFHVRAWRLLHPESVPLIDVPPEIAPDL